MYSWGYRVSVCLCCLNKEKNVSVSFILVNNHLDNLQEIERTCRVPLGSPKLCAGAP